MLFFNVGPKAFLLCGIYIDTDILDDKKEVICFENKN
jgi:hypothetical protein